MPASTVIPVLAYPNVSQAAAWLCDAFGFTMRVRIADHRVQLNAGDGAVVVAERQHSVEDSGGHQWTFSQSIADVAPEEWGGVSGQL
jgi:uncharacterized glyoxalase superfamily protein PhnB